jgi:hypothetical protein
MAFLGHLEEVQFARTLSSENGRFLRRVVRLQSNYTPATTKFVRLLYRNEYVTLDEINNDGISGNADRSGDNAEVKERAENQDSQGVQIDVNMLFAVYPRPVAINTANLADAINQVTPIADFIVDAASSADGLTDEAVKTAYRGNIIKDLTPQIDWNRYSDILERTKVECNKRAEQDKASNGTDPNSMDNGGDGTGEENNAVDAAGNPDNL